MSPLSAQDVTDPVVAPSCRQCEETSLVQPVEVTDVHPGVHYWRCDACAFVWATRDLESRSIAANRACASLHDEEHESSRRERPIYEDNLQARLDAAMARTRRFITSTQPVRAPSQHGLPFSPSCMNCQQSGRRHPSPPTFEQHYVCAHCHRRWVAQPSAS